MQFWKRNRRVSQQGETPGDAGQVQKARRTIKRSPPVAMEVKLLAIEALESGLSVGEVGELVGVGSSTIHKWNKDYAEEGVQGLWRRRSRCESSARCWKRRSWCFAGRIPSTEFDGFGTICDAMRGSRSAQRRCARWSMMPSWAIPRPSHTGDRQHRGVSSARARMRCGRSISSPSI